MCGVPLYDEDSFTSSSPHEPRGKTSPPAGEEDGDDGHTKN